MKSKARNRLKIARARGDTTIELDLQTGKKGSSRETSPALETLKRKIRNS